MIVILEGPDGAGKTTMVDSLRRFHHMQIGMKDPATSQVWHAGPFPEGGNPWTEYVVPLSQLMPSRDWLVIIDRWHLGELVYGPLLRGQSRLSMEQCDWIDGYLKSLGAVLVYLKATPEELTRRLGERGDDLIKAEQLPYLLAKYDELTTRRTVPLVTTRMFNTTGNKPDPTAVGIHCAAGLEAGMALRTWTNEPYWETHPWPS